MSFYTKAWLVSFTALWLVPPFAGGQGLERPPSTVEASDQQEAAPAELAGYEFSFPAMGTLVQVKTFSSDPSLVKAAFEAAEAEVQRLQGILSDYDSESETRRLTTVAVRQPTQVSPELWAMLAASEHWYGSSDGAFDASLGAVTRLWRQSRRSGSIPSQHSLAVALKHTGWQHVQLDATERTVELAIEGLYLDFGGIGKGYIVDRVFDLLAERGLTTTLVNISGNMRCGAAPPDREGWRIAIAPLEKDGQPLRRISLRHTAIATSGDLWQYQEIDGIRRSHIVDPQTGLGVPGPLSATVIAPRAADADALATAACVLHVERALKLASELDEVELLLARENAQGELVVDESPGFPHPD
jgi:FAD:protein FMN transferase